MMCSTLVFFHEKSMIFSQKILFRLGFPDILRGLVLMNLILAILWYSFDMTVQEDPHTAAFAEINFSFGWDQKRFSLCYQYSFCFTLGG